MLADNKLVDTFKKNIIKIEERLKEKKIVIIYGGFGEEREASFGSGQEVFNALSTNKFNLALLDPAQDNLFEKLDPDKDVVFNCLHGEFGESGHLSSILDYLRIPYTFSGLYTSVICMDKLYFKAVLEKLGLTSPVDNYDKDYLKEGRRYVHKKIRGGGSIDMFMDEKPETSKGFFTEEFIQGKILTLGILESQGLYELLGIVEIKLQNKSYYDKQAKYEGGFHQYIEYSGINKLNIGQSALKIANFLRIKGGARLDLIETENRLYFLEMNTVPGLYEDSNMAFSARLKGMSFYELLIYLLDNAGCQKL